MYESLVYQGIYGKGLANYIQDISSLGYDLVPKTTNGYLKASDMWGVFAAFQQNWTPKLYSSLMYSKNEKITERGCLLRQPFRLEAVFDHQIDTAGIPVSLVKIIASSEQIFHSGSSVFGKIP